MLAARLAQLCRGVLTTKRTQGSKIRVVTFVCWIFHSSFGSATNLCNFDQSRSSSSILFAFNHLAQEFICDPKNNDEIGGTQCTFTTYEYKLKIPVKNATDCGVRLRRDADEPKELTQPAECQDFFDRKNVTSMFPRRGPLCLDMWFMNNYKSYVAVSYITTDPSGLPKQGQYEVMMQNANKTFFLIKSRRSASTCDRDECVYHNREIHIEDAGLATCINYNRHLHRGEIDFPATIHANDTLTCCRGRTLGCNEDSSHAWRKHALFTPQVGGDNLSVTLNVNSPLFGNINENVYTCECDFSDATYLPNDHKVCFQFRYKDTAHLATLVSCVVVLSLASIFAAWYGRRRFRRRKLRRQARYDPVRLRTNPVSVASMITNRRNLEEAIKDKTGISPVWIEACNEMCGESCALHYNVAEIRYEDTVFGKVLGSGQYGTVLKGVVKFGNNISIDVAIKKSECHEVNLLKEGELMARVRGHDHVAYLQGLMLDENRFYLVMSLCTNQSLREFLNENKEAMRLEKDDKKKLQWAKQICDGMIWLQERRVVHMDLATRNILLTNPDELAKITDFGLSRIIQRNEPENDDDSGSMVGRAQYEQSISSETNISTTGATGSKLPLTIMPPEIWDSRENVNFATDVWSFGILLWEMFTGGQDINRHMKCLYAQASSSSPFSSFLYHWIDGGNRLPLPWPEFRPTQPSHANEVSEIILSCWSEVLEERQTFPWLERKFEKLIPQEELQSTRQAVELERRTYGVARSTLDQASIAGRYLEMIGPVPIDSMGYQDKKALLANGSTNRNGHVPALAITCV